MDENFSPAKVFYERREAEKGEIMKTLFFVCSQ
jgi:hypothetical protein